VNIERKEARHLLDALTHLRKAVAIAQIATRSEPGADDMRQLAIERCIEIADEAFQRSGSAAEQIDHELQLHLSSLRHFISRDYNQVNPEILRRTVARDVPRLVEKIESLEGQLYEIAELEKPPAPEAP